ncbi:hypothetical protein D3C85_1308510 [compost metagenome]
MVEFTSSAILTSTVSVFGTTEGHCNVIPQAVVPGVLCSGPLDMEAQAMTIEARIRELGNRHRSLDETIQQEARRPTADPIHLRELKQRKLRLKEEITSLEARTH